MAPASLAAHPARCARSPLPAASRGSRSRSKPSSSSPAAWSRVSRAGASSPAGAGQAGGQGLQFEGVAVGHRCGDGWGAGLAAADQALGEAVQEPGQQPAAAEPGPAGQPAQDLGLHGQPDGQAGPLHVLGGAAAAVDLEQVAGVALEVDAQVGAGALVVAAGHLVEHVPFGD